MQPHDLLKFGIIPELVGRLPVISPLRSLEKEDLIRILTEPKNALVRQYRKLLELDHVELEITSDALEVIAQKAIDRQIGARGLRARDGGDHDPADVRDPVGSDHSEGCPYGRLRPGRRGRGDPGSQPSQSITRRITVSDWGQGFCPQLRRYPVVSGRVYHCWAGQCREDGANPAWKGDDID